MKNFILLIAICLALAGTMPSCETPTNYGGAVNVQVSTYTVQGAEHTLRAAKDTFDLFFGLVKDNHDLVVTKLPAVYAFAQKMQVQAPATLRKANDAKNAFKYNRTPDGQASLNTIMATVAALMLDTQSQIKTIQTTL